MATVAAQARPPKASRELAAAISEDQRRAAVDAAKKRAVAQAADYDTFKKLVSVAHLKPLSAPSGAHDANTGPLLPAWRLDAAGQLAGAGSCASAPSSIGSSEAPPNEARPLPHNSAEFGREWRRAGSLASKWALLKACGPAAMGSVFRVEINGDQLGQVLIALQQVWHSRGSQGTPCEQAAVPGSGSCTSAAWDALAEARFTLALLAGLTAAGRFDLNVRLIGSRAKAAARDLCSQLAEALQRAGAASELQQLSLRDGKRASDSCADELALLQQLVHKLGVA